MAAYLAPYVLFSKAINEGFHHEYLNIPKPSSFFVFPARFAKGDTDGEVFQGQDNLWMNFHFSDYLIPTPLRHPYFIMVPQISSQVQEGKALRIGMSFIEPHTRNEYASFMTGETFYLEMEAGKQKLFNIPFFKKHIAEKNLAVIWEDLFTLDVTGGLKLYGGVFSSSLLWEGASAFWKTPIEEWVYRLYILEKRGEFFSPEVQSVSFRAKNKIGIAKIKTVGNARMLTEVFYIPHEKEVHTLSFKTYPWDAVARGIRKKFLDTLEYKKTDPHVSYSIYDSYSKLSYSSKIDQEGFTYLYCAWSHQTNSKDFLRSMIRFLEKGKDYSLQTTPLYEYAYRKFGSNFSTREDTVKESSESRLKRKMGEELEKQISEEERKKLPDSEGNFQSEEAKMNYYLQKAKEKGSNSDKNENSLEMN